MRPFEEAFPGFISSCTKLHDQFVPVAMAILILSFAFHFWANESDPLSIVRFLGKLFLIALLISNTDTLLRQGQVIVQEFVVRNVDAHPEKVAERYKQQLASVENDASVNGQSWWDMLFSARFFEALIYAALLLVSWLAMALLFYIYLLQKVLLMLCWVMSPVLFAFFAIPLVSGLALRHALRIIGILLWPIGLALAATITDGLLSAQVDQSFFGADTVGGKFQYIVVNLLGVALIALWILFSTILAPAMMSRLVAGTGGSAHTIARAANLLTTVGLPLLTGLLSAQRHSPERSERSRADALTPPTLIHVPEPVSASPVDPPTLRSLSADDPTAENAVREVLDKSGRE